MFGRNFLAGIHYKKVAALEAGKISFSITAADI
jgi:hypothetical protein